MDAEVCQTVETIEAAVGPDRLIQILKAGLESHLAKVRDLGGELEAHRGGLTDELWAVVEAAEPSADLSFEAKDDRLLATIKGDLGPDFEARLAAELERIATDRPELAKLLGVTTYVIDRGEWATEPGGKVDRLLICLYVAPQDDAPGAEGRAVPGRVRRLDQGPGYVRGRAIRVGPPIGGEDQGEAGERAGKLTTEPLLV